MSAYEDDPGHFVEFLLRHAPEFQLDSDIGSQFVPRRQYGRYLCHTLQALPRIGSLHHLQDRALDIEQDQGALIRLASGRSIRADHVVLAVGNAPRELPGIFTQTRILIANAWDYAAVAAITPTQDVAVIGSGLSMVDAVLTLAQRGHQGKIQVLSRHGLMPLPHAEPGPHSGEAAHLLGLDVRGQASAIRAQVRAAVASGEHWQWTFDRLRPHGEALWTSLSHAQQRRFLRHLVRFWDIHRHRIAPSVHAKLEALQTQGQLQVIAGCVLAVEATDHAAARIRYRPRHSGDTQALTASWIVNATGIQTNIDLRPDPLMQALRARGSVSPGPHGIGIASEGVGIVLDRHGQPQQGRYVIGALRIGNLWESVAIPELRMQATRVAQDIRRQHRAAR